MSNVQIQTVSDSSDKAKLFGAIALLLVSLALYVVLDKQTSLIRIGSFAVVLIAAIALFFTSFAGRRLISFGKVATKELKKVVWPTRKEASQITLYVFVFVLVMAIFLWGVDKSLEYLIFHLLLNWRT